MTKNAKPYRVHVTNRFNDTESYKLWPYATTADAIGIAKKVTVDFLKGNILKNGEETSLGLLDYFLESGDFPQVIGQRGIQHRSLCRADLLRTAWVACARATNLWQCETHPDD